MAQVQEAKKPITKKEAVVEIPAGTMGKVSETRDDKGNLRSQRVEYQAEIKENEIETNAQRENTNDESFISSYNETDYTEIPKSPLENMFDMVKELDRDGAEIFYANLTRYPDSLSDRFNYPCNTQMTLGAFMFTVRDFMNFIPSIQKLNGNSGGRFNVTVFDSSGNPAQVLRVINFHETFIPVGVKNLSVPNPVIDNSITAVDNTNGLAAIVEQLQKDNREQMNRVMDLIRNNQQPREASEIEKAIQSKMLDLILNPPKPEQNNAEKMIENITTSLAVTTALGDALAKNIHREPPPPREPTMLEQVKELGDSPMGQSIIDRIGNIAEAVVVSKLPAAASPDEQQNPAVDAEQTDTEMLMETIIDELQTDNVLNEHNETIQQLVNDYPKQAALLIETCQEMSFNGTVKMLGRICGDMNPNPFLPFLDIDASKKTNAYVWNDEGKKLLARLEEFYNFARNFKPATESN